MVIAQILITITWIIAAINYTDTWHLLLLYNLWEVTRINNQGINPGDPYVFMDTPCPLTIYELGLEPTFWNPLTKNEIVPKMAW